jgi:hyperosmotically inducible periplasmic protein
MEHPHIYIGRTFKVAVLLTSAAAFLPGQDQPAKPDTPTKQDTVATQDKTTKPDNTRVNQADRAPGAVTADQQKNNKTDKETTRQIRKALVGDKSLSTYAHNVKVISQNGTVTLKGPVKTDDEKKAVESKAAEVAGASNIKSEITVTGDTDKK